MTMIRVTTRKLDATDNHDDRIKVSFSTGEEGTFPYPYREGLDGVEAHEHCIAKLMSRETFDKIESFYKVGDAPRGYQFTIFLKG